MFQLIALLFKQQLFQRHTHSLLFQIVVGCISLLKDFTYIKQQYSQIEIINRFVPVEYKHQIVQDIGMKNQSEEGIIEIDAQQYHLRGYIHRENELNSNQFTEICNYKNIGQIIQCRILASENGGTLSLILTLQPNKQEKEFNQIQQQLEKGNKLDKINDSSQQRQQNKDIQLVKNNNGEIIGQIKLGLIKEEKNIKDEKINKDHNQQKQNINQSQLQSTQSQSKKQKQYPLLRLIESDSDFYSPSIVYKLLREIGIQKNENDAIDLTGEKEEEITELKSLSSQSSQNISFPPPLLSFAFNFGDKQQQQQQQSSSSSQQQIQTNQFNSIQQQSSSLTRSDPNVTQMIQQQMQQQLQQSQYQFDSSVLNRQFPLNQFHQVIHNHFNKYFESETLLLRSKQPIKKRFDVLRIEQGSIYADERAKRALELISWIENEEEDEDINIQRLYLEEQKKNQNRIKEDQKQNKKNSLIKDAIVLDNENDETNKRLNQFHFIHFDQSKFMNPITYYPVPIQQQQSQSNILPLPCFPPLPQMDSKILDRFQRIIDEAKSFDINCPRASFAQAMIHWRQAREEGMRKYGIGIDRQKMNQYVQQSKIYYNSFDKESIDWYLMKMNDVLNEMEIAIQIVIKEGRNNINVISEKLKDSEMKENKKEMKKDQNEELIQNNKEKEQQIIRENITQHERDTILQQIIEQIRNETSEERKRLEIQKMKIKEIEQEKERERQIELERMKEQQRIQQLKLKGQNIGEQDINDEEEDLNEINEKDSKNESFGVEYEERMIREALLKVIEQKEKEKELEKDKEKDKKHKHRHKHKREKSKRHEKHKSKKDRKKKHHKDRSSESDTTSSSSDSSSSNESESSTDSISGDKNRRKKKKQEKHNKHSHGRKRRREDSEDSKDE